MGIQGIKLLCILTEWLTPSQGNAFWVVIVKLILGWFRKVFLFWLFVWLESLEFKNFDYSTESSGFMTSYGFQLIHQKEAKQYLGEL